MRLAPGRLLVKPVETAETLGGGKIILTEATREHWTMGQAEVLAVGPPAICTEEDCERPHVIVWHGADAHGKRAYRQGHPVEARLLPGAWVLCKPRRFVEVEGGYLVMQDDVVAVFTAPTD